MHKLIYQIRYAHLCFEKTVIKCVCRRFEEQLYVFYKVICNTLTTAPKPFMSLFLTVSLQIHGQEQLNMHRKTGPSDAKIFKQRLDHFAFGPNALKTFD